MAAVAVGAWLLFVRDTGPSDAELAAEERAERAAQVEAEAEAVAAQCGQQLDDLLVKLEDLESRLGVGVSYEEYGRRVGDVNSAYSQTPFGQLDGECVTNAGIHAENALNEYIEAGNVWSDCFSDFDCDTDSIDPDLQEHWLDASEAIGKANHGLNQLAP